RRFVPRGRELAVQPPGPVWLLLKREAVRRSLGRFRILLERRVIAKALLRLGLGEYRRRAADTTLLRAGRLPLRPVPSSRQWRSTSRQGPVVAVVLAGRAADHPLISQ